MATARRELKAETLEAWDARLFLRLCDIISQRAVTFRFATFRAEAILEGAQADGSLRIRCQGGDITWSWARLGRAERRSLGQNLSATNPADHCLVAFYLLEEGKAQDAQMHLAAGEAGAAEVLAAFK